MILIVLHYKLLLINCVVRSRIYALHAGDAVQNYRSYRRTDATRMHGALSAIAEHLCE